MKNRKFNFNVLLAGVALINILFACTDDDGPKGEYTDGIYIVNEGTDNNGSVSFYSYGSDKVINQVFATKNKRPLGTYVQNIKLYKDNAYIVVNNSNKVEVVNRYTMEEQGVIVGVASPRYMVAKDNKGYVTCWGSNSVKVVDLNTLLVTDSIALSSGPEKMLIKNDLLYVVNSGGWSYDSTLSVIDLATEKVIKNIFLADVPIDLVEDNSGNIWVLCSGRTVYDSKPPYDLLDESPSKIIKIDTKTNNPILEIALFADKHPMSLETDKDGSYLYFGGGYSFDGIYKLDISTGQAKATQIVQGFAYGFNIDEKTNVIFACYSPDFGKAGTLKRYDIDGVQLGSYTVGIGPNGTALKKAL
jgi:YVTN family beta-propeller protein